MERISVEELSEDTVGIVARVEAGESIGITDRGELVARLVPISDGKPGEEV